MYPLIAPTQIKQTFANWQRGYAMGKQAPFLLDYRFEAQWDHPIADLRTALGLELAEASAQQHYATS
ncbi:hypothetical protein IQ266_21900 [filamentous cyanobacterium LEGE 11480]|uniref:Uncharacterized protein n=2 Tax=Romeriopsis TaxID=2992131 RepID=A0A928VSV7_9CYAN|nr:hypothetical protein [Romeriopsis navalis LEGE 11480]